MSIPRIRSAIILLSLAAISAAAVGAIRSKSQPSTTGSMDIVVTDAATELPIAGAWVCVGQSADGDGDQVLEASSSFADAQGLASMPTFQTGPMLLNVTADGYGSLCRPLYRMPIGDDDGDHPERIDVELVPDNAVQVWGQVFGGTCVASVWIEGEFGDSKPLAVADGSGVFSLAVEQGQSSRVRAISPLAEPVVFTVDSSSPGSFSAPKALVTVSCGSMSTVTAQVALASSGSPAVSAGSVEVSACLVKAGGLLDFQRSMVAEEDPQGILPVSWESSERFAATSSIVLMAKAGSAWGATLVTAGGGQPAQIMIDDTSQGSIDIELTEVNGSPVSSGSIALYLEDLNALGVSGVKLLLDTVPPNSAGSTSLNGLPPGTYGIVWTDGPRRAARVGIDVGPGENVMLSLRSDDSSFSLQSNPQESELPR